MPPASQWIFGPFRLDPRNAFLWRGVEIVPLPPTAFALLHYLVTHAGQLVTKDELFEAIWSETVVSEAVLKVRMGEVRKALGETAREPRCIATVHRRGYRFVAPVTRLDVSPGAAAAARDPSRPPLAPTVPMPLLPRPSPPDTPTPLPRLVGREGELAQLQQWWAQARRGQRQVVFLTGEAGIGKTTLVDAFVEQVVATEAVWLAQGQCIEQYGVGEAYLPVLEALGRLCCAPGEAQLLTLLRAHAPTWLVQMPWVLSTADHEALRYELLGATQARMLREMAAWIEALTVEMPLVLVLEDLHWSDYATLDLVAWLARRQEPARLLLVGTYRPVEVMTRGHPLRDVQQALQMHGHCAELSLAFLSESAVAAYLTRRVPGYQEPAALARIIHQRTDGNPLFMVQVVEELMTQGRIGEQQDCWDLHTTPDADVVRVPEGIRQMLALQLDRLPLEEQRLLEAASVAGAAFAAASVAAGLASDVVTSEEHCERLAQRQQFLRPAETVTWPDGTVTGRYEFIHALYQNVVYQQMAAARRVRLHQRIGERLEEAYGAHADDMAAELAMHFEQSRDYPRAIHYLQQAAENAVRRHANREALAHLTKGLELLKTRPATPARSQQELMLHLALGGSLFATKGYAAPEVEQTYTRARYLCQYLEDPQQLFPVLRGLWVYYLTRAELQTAYAFSLQLLTLAQQAQDSAMLLEAHRALGATLLYRGAGASALTHLTQGMALYDPQQHRASTFLYGDDTGVVCHSLAAWTLWSLGYPDQGLARSHEALLLAQQRAHPFSLGFALCWAAVVHQYRREVQAAQEHAEAAISLAIQQGFPFFRAFGSMLRGWALARQGQAQEGVEQLRQGLLALHVTGIEIARLYFLALLAEAYETVGQPAAGLEVLAEALTRVDTTSDCWYEPELYRLKGALLLQQSADNQVEAKAFLYYAIDAAHAQQAKALELRTAVSLSRLWQQQGKSTEAHELLAPIYGWFTEGFDTADLQEAKTLLEDLISR
jgi:predicted ATPase/DNA-binding winged helix-turn-helix (wHTH) protein